nr:hypothetical protein BgiMline_014002 [Biomphalaria glabrata]
MRLTAVIAGLVLVLATLTSAFYRNYGVAQGFPPYSPIGRTPFYGGRGRYWGDGPGDDFDDGFYNGYRRPYHNYRVWND